MYCPIRYSKLLNLVILLLGLNLVWVMLSYLVNIQSLEGVVSSVRLFITAVIVHYLVKVVSREATIKFIIFIAIFNGLLVLLQVFEQYMNLDVLPVSLRYGGMYGFDKLHDYEIFKKGGIFPSSQASGFLALTAIMLVMTNYRDKGLIFMIIPGILFGGRSVFVLFILYLLYIIYKSLKNLNKSLNIRKKNFVYALISIFMVYLYFQSEYSLHHLYRLNQAINVFLDLDLAQDQSVLTSISYLRAPDSVMELFFGNGMPRFDSLGGNDVFYSRWYLQSGVPSLIFILSALAITGYVEHKTTNSFGLVTLLFLVHGFKDEVITSSFVFLVYLLFIFSIKNIVNDNKDSYFSDNAILNKDSFSDDTHLKDV
jgi:hypothetical protein